MRDVNIELGGLLLDMALIAGEEQRGDRSLMESNASGALFVRQLGARDGKHALAHVDGVDMPDTADNRLRIGAGAAAGGGRRGRLSPPQGVSVRGTSRRAV